MIVMAIEMPMMVAVMSSAPNRDEGADRQHHEAEGGRTGDGLCEVHERRSTDPSIRLRRPEAFEPGMGLVGLAMMPR